jgi:phospholipid/cholesterol/gamma-HCH transport system ATP-binding protein
MATLEPERAPDREPAIVELEDVHLAFGENRVLRGVDLEVRRGETFGLLGASGSGKTVILRVVLGLERPDRGRVRLFGEDVYSLSDRELEPLRRRTSVVYQAGALFSALSVEENVALVLREVMDLPEAEVRARVDDALEAVGLGDVDRTLPPVSLSGGMKKRLAVARAIAPRPELVFYDEPTSGLDPFNSARVLELIRELHDERHVTSIVVTHDVAGACAVSSRVGLIVNGRFAYVGPPAGFLASRDPDVLAYLQAATPLLPAAASPA